MLKRERATDGTKKQKIDGKRLRSETVCNEELANDVQECRLFTSLRLFERQIDAILTRRRAELMDAARMLLPQNRTFKMYIYNTYKNQGAGYSLDNQDLVLFNEAQAPSQWTLRIVGDDTNSGKKFTEYFKRIFIEFEPIGSAENAAEKEKRVLEWDRSQAAESDGFEIKQEGSADVMCRFQLHLAYSPPRYRLSAPLANLLKVHTDTRPKILLAFWQYVKHNKLQDVQDKRFVKLNDELKEIFKEAQSEQIMFSDLSSLLRDHLLPPNPIQIEYRVRLTGDPKENMRCWELSITEQPNLASLSTVNHKQLHELDETIAQKLETIEKCRKRRTFAQAFSDNPVQFMTQIVASKARDIETQRGENMSGGSFWDTDSAKDALYHYLRRCEEDHALDSRT